MERTRSARGRNRRDAKSTAERFFKVALKSSRVSNVSLGDALGQILKFVALEKGAG